MAGDRISSPQARRPAGAGTRLAVQLLIATGGVAALSWEMIWQLESALALGVSALGTAVTLAVTMAGMTLGAVGAGRWLRDREVAQPLRLYGALELVVGLCGLLLLPGFRLLEVLDGRVYDLLPGAATGVHVLGIALLVGPATLAMGATVPVFQLLSRPFGVSVSALYGINTAGAAAGVLGVNFLLLPRLGVGRTVLAVAALNLCVFAASRFERKAVPVSGGPATREAAGVPAGGPRLTYGLAQLIVFGTGFVTFGLEVAWFRALRAAFWSTSHTFAIILASVLIPLAVGARLVGRMRGAGIAPGTVLAGAGIAILLATPLVERMDLFLPVAGTYSLVLARWLLLTLAFIGPAIVLLSMALPWCLDAFPDPSRTGRLYGANTLGAVVGSIFVAWLVLPELGFAQTAGLLGIATLGLGLLAGPTPARWLAVAGGGAAVVAAVVFASSPGRQRYAGYSDFHGHEIVAIDEGPDSTVTVVDQPNGTRVLVIDGFVASSEAELGAHYMHWMGSLPMLVHENPASALVIGFGTGQTANALRREGPQSLDVVDVSRAVLEAAPLFARNEGVLDDPRVRSVHMDGRAWLRRTGQRYDVVTLEPMPPNFFGVNSLYSREFYEIVRDRLNPGGILTQWLPVHLVTPEHAASIATTFQAVFPESILWIDPISGTGILLGRKGGGAQPLHASWPGLERSRRKRSLRDFEIRQAAYLYPEELARYAERGTLITDDNQLLSFGQIRAGDKGKTLLLNKFNHRILWETTDRAPFSLVPDWRLEQRLKPPPAVPRNAPTPGTSEPPQVPSAPAGRAHDRS